ncbi:MAG: hypothetical protein ACN4GG_02165 [Akkermansiaceae bacterium]
MRPRHDLVAGWVSHFLFYQLILWTVAPLSASEKLGELSELFHASLDYYDELQRTPEGYYRDAYLIGRAQNKRCSIAAVGVGLVALCMDDQLGRDPDAEKKALITIRALSKIGRDSTGFFRHFFQSDTGTSKSECSTIDTAILVAGVLACRNHFSDPRIHHEADQLWNSIDWSAALVSQDGRKLFMVMENGKGAKVTQLFNEYLILAEFIRAQQLAKTGKSQIIGINDLPSFKLDGLDIASEPRYQALSSFALQFPFYLSHAGATDRQYQKFCLAQARADQRAMTKHTNSAELWGCGAGGTPDRGYHADSFLNNPTAVVSPHIIAGFLPVYPEAKDHLLKIYRESTRRLKTPVGELLPRFSVDNPAWRAHRIEAIDYSSMIYGLAAIHPDLGMAFFQKTTKVSFITNDE